MKLICTLAIAALVAIPATASAQDPDGKPARERSAEVGDGSRVICRTSNVTGSRVRAARVCQTADEWAAQKRDTRNQVEQEQQRRPHIDTAPG